MKSWLGIFLAIVSLFFNFFFYQKAKKLEKTENKYKVYAVTDGDSFIIDLDHEVRLDGIDAPAIDLCLGKEAKERLEELILDKYVRIKSLGKDTFRRTLGIVYIDEEEASVNEILAREGWGKYERTGCEIKERIKEASRLAKEERLGVWSPKCYQLENREEPNCSIKGNIGKTDRSKVYHFPGCSEYERTVVELDLGEEWFCSEEEAREAGYRKSEHCFDLTYSKTGTAVGQIE